MKIKSKIKDKPAHHAGLLQQLLPLKVHFYKKDFIKASLSNIY